MDELEMAVASALADGLRAGFNFDDEEEAEEGGLSVTNVEVSFEEGLATLTWAFADAEGEADDDDDDKEG